MIRTIFREANKPEPTEKIEKSGRVNWGEKNLYAQFLNGLYYDNPIHSGIINQKVKFITAGGITVEGDQIALTNYGGTENLQELIDSAVRDFEIGETFCIIYKKSSVSGMWIGHNVDFELIRATENMLFFEYSEDWSKTKQDEKTGFKKIKSIHYVTSEDKECIMTNITRPKQRAIENSKTKAVTLTSNYYPAVNYAGAITSILAGIEMDYFTFSEVVNSYKGGTLINLANGIPDSIAKEDAIIKRVKNEASNRDTQGGLSITFSEGKDRAPEVHQLNGTDLDKRYIESNKEILRKIMIAHGVISPALFGVMSETMFGGKEEMEIAYKLFQENYVKMRQRVISDALTWAYKRLNAFNGKIIFNDYILSLDQNVAETNAVSTALNSMSPLVANKVLEVLTTNERRGLAKLIPLPDGDTIPNVTAAFSSESDEQKILELFASCGTPKNEHTILFSKARIEQDDDSFKDEFLTGLFAISLTDEDRIILRMIKDGETYPAVSNAIGKGGAYLSKRLISLDSNGYIKDWTVTDKGIQQVATKNELQVVYSYEKKPGIPDLVPGGTSRPFCKALINADKVYTKEEITAIGNAVGRDVWSYRGGWYHNPDTERNTPSCRHLWDQHITIKMN